MAFIAIFFFLRDNIILLVCVWLKLYHYRRNDNKEIRLKRWAYSRGGRVNIDFKRTNVGTRVMGVGMARLCPV
jgi:hypothetical protein